MRIEYENEDANKVSFLSLDEGECFTQDGILYMKTTSNHFNDFAIVNAVVIGDGTLCGFADTELVIPTEAKVVVE